MSKKSKFIIFILLTILVVLIIIGVYFTIEKNGLPSTSHDNLSNPEVLDEPQNESDSENVVNYDDDEDSKNTAATNKSKNEVTKVSLDDDDENLNQAADIDELKKFLTTYSVSIERITYAGGENLESNTVLLFLAKQFFDTNSSKKASLKVDTTYASTSDNIHKYLTELTGTDYTKVDTVNSYKNYIGYSTTNKAYVYGKDISVLKEEKYECPKLEIIREDNGIYTAIGEVIRISNNEETVYDISFNFQINSKYKYQKYQVVSLKTTNKSFYPDNTVHLIEQVEETNTGKKKK